MSVTAGMSTKEEIISHLRKSDDPFMTAPEIAESMDMTRQAISHNLRELHEQGRVERKSAGSRAVGWWLVED
jgi:predicted transcriptional regulator